VTRIRIIDAFTDRPFSGNPAAVCLLGGGQWPDERWMRQVAMEMSLSQTAFARPLRDDAGAGYDFVSRFFSPADEIPEDPVTGSAHTALSPFWAGRLGAA
jgi:predicted PhzF superfamily epimerase YddE/YHI9